MSSEVPTTTAPHQTIAEGPTARSDLASVDRPAEIEAHAPGKVQVIRRNGKVTHFDANKIMVAMTKAFLAVEGGSAAASTRVHDRVQELTEQVVSALTRRLPGGGTVHIEDIQDQVELALMRAGEHKVARDYVIYRDERARERAQKAAASAAANSAQAEEHQLRVTLADGSTKPLDVERMRRLVDEACRDLDGVDAEAILTDTCRNLFDGVREADVGQALVAGDGERQARSDTDANEPLEASPRLSLPVRAVLVVVGTTALVIGVIGIVVPVLPTTPFLLVAAACYARSSTRLYAWLLGQPSLGRIVAEWRRSRSLPPGVKPRALLVVA